MCSPLRLGKVIIIEMKVYLVRHGESVNNDNGQPRTAETPLSELGENQARAVAKRLSDLKFDLIYSSSYTRAKQTAEIISTQLDKPIEYWDHLIEFNPQAENFDKLAKRAQAILDHLLNHHRDQTVLCVSHASMIETIIAKAVFGDHLTQEMLIDIKDHFDTTNTGISIVHFTKEHGWSLQSFNDAEHL